MPHNQIVNILASKPRISLHDYTGDELVVYIKIPPGKADMREMAAEWIASSIKNNMELIIQHAIADVNKLQKEVG
ncbi:MAG TPA: hypothetical protein DD734_03480 [Firmicutes bacterium]|nr:hypothetical protein [Bacillota bacterium]